LSSWERFLHQKAQHNAKQQRLAYYLQQSLKQMEFIRSFRLEREVEAKHSEILDKDAKIESLNLQIKLLRERIGELEHEAENRETSLEVIRKGPQRKGLPNI
jgi:hypothetical protein